MWFMKVGNRITGPFNEDEMRAKRLCKELAPFHLVSRDGIRWESAAQLVNLLDGPPPDWKSRRPPEPEVARTREPRTETDPTPQPPAQWYYVDSSRKQLGPISHESLCDLLKTRKLSGKTLVCKAGETQWEQAGRHPTLASFVPSGTSRTQVIAGSATLGVAAIVALLIFLPSRLASHSNPTQSGSSTRASWSDSQLLITSTEDRDKFSYAVGLVLGTYREPNLDGSPGQKKESGTGSAFAITADGYLLTNRHVAVMGNPEKKKEDLCQHYDRRIKVYKSEYERLTELRDANLNRISKQDLEEFGLKLKKIATVFAYYTKLKSVVQSKSTDIEPKLVVFFGGVPLDAKIVHISTRFDVAILKVERSNRRPFFALDINNEIEDGTELTILGFPGIANEARSDADIAIQTRNEEMEIDPVEKMMPQHLKQSRTQGIVNRCTEDSSRTWSIEHQVPTFPGNSGSPVFQKNGVVVGIHTQGITLEGGGAKLNVAFSVGQFRKEIEEYIAGGVVWKSK